MLLQVENISKSFGGKQVLKDISLSVNSGSALGLLGRNGAGKTTAIRIIMGVFPADGGSVLVDGEAIDRSKIKLGYLPEERGLYPKKQIMEQLVYLAQLRGMKAGQARQSAEKWLKRIDMSDTANKKLNTLSKGNQQKIQLAATLLNDPDIVILDEPFSGLDPVNAMLLKDIVKELIDRGVVVLFSSHQMNYIEEFCNDIAILNKGEIVLAGKINSIKREYDRSRIIINGDDIGHIAAYIRDNMRDIAKAVEETENGIFVTLAEQALKNKLINGLSQQNFDIDCFVVYEPSLQEIFVQYTEEAI